VLKRFVLGMAVLDRTDPLRITSSGPPGELIGGEVEGSNRSKNRENV